MTTIILKEPSHIWYGFEWFGLPATDWIIAIGTFVTLGTLIFLYSNSKKDRREREKAEEKKLIDTLKYSKVFLESVIVPLERQKKINDELIEQLQVQKVIDIKFQFITSLTIKWDIDKNALSQAFFKYFIGDNKNKLFYFNQFIIFSKIIEHIANNIENDFYKIIEVSNKYEGLFNSGKTILIKEMDKAIRIVKEANTPEVLQARTHVNFSGLSPMQKELVEATNEWYGIQPETAKHDMFTTYNKFILASQPIVQKYWDENLLESLRITDYAFESYKKNMEINTRKFTAYSNGIGAACKRFKVLIRNLEKSISRIDS